jgi:hypothetical protein
MHNFTPDDLVQYLYKETTDEKAFAIKTALETDYSLKEMYDVIVSGHKRLEALKLSPRKEAVDKILRYAQKSMTELHH